MILQGPCDTPPYPSVSCADFKAALLKSPLYKAPKPGLYPVRPAMMFAENMTRDLTTILRVLSYLIAPTVQ